MNFSLFPPLLALVWSISPVVNAQVYRVDLPKLSVLDGGAHLTVFSPSPKSHLELPSIDTTGAKFFDVFFGWRITEDPNVAVMVIPAENGEQLYIDINNNKDLRDDGSPYFFSATENNFSFDIVAPDDPQQREKILLQRKPDFPDSVMHMYVDTNGNLNPLFAKFWGGMIGFNTYAGTRGTFYFDDRVTLRSGSLAIAGRTYEVGLYDFSSNGLYNDELDRFLIDQDNDGKLSSGESFSLNDVFILNGINFKISRLDKYGTWVELSRTTDPATSYLLKSLSQSSGPAFEGTVDTLIWSVSAPSVHGGTLSLREYRGEYLLLNFWGEWCQPCVAEIPSLIEAQEQYRPRGLQIVSFLKSSNLQKARNIIRERGMNWPQLILSEALEKQFMVSGYPTNILILPDGKSFVRQSGQLSPEFLKSKLQ